MTKIGLPVENVEIILGDNNIKTDDRIFTDYFRDKEVPAPFSLDEDELNDMDPCIFL